MLGLSRKTEYALLAISHLMEAGQGEVVRTREIVERFGVPAELMAKVLQKLVRDGMLVSTPGPTGGYTLAGDTADLTIGRVVRAVEGRTTLVSCINNTSSDCEQHATCTIRGPLERIDARVQNLLDHISVREVCSPTIPQSQTIAIPLVPVTSGSPVPTVPGERG